MTKHKLLAVVGPTASGKSDLAVELARTFDGEVISADSRQVYRDLNIGTGKITSDEMKGIAHHLLDVADPEEQFSVAEYKKQADEAVFDIHNAGKLPILCGGTGYYIQAVVDDVLAPEVPPNKELRSKLLKLSTEELFEILKEIDPHRAATIEHENPRRLIRAIEIADTLGSVPPVSRNERFNTLQIGLALPKEELRGRINTRLSHRLKDGMIDEAKNLHTKGLSHERMEELGLEYRYVSRYLRNMISREELEQELQWKIWQYAQRQMRWFKRDTRIKWFHPSDRQSIEDVVKLFLG